MGHCGCKPFCERSQHFQSPCLAAGTQEAAAPYLCESPVQYATAELKDTAALKLPRLLNSETGSQSRAHHVRSPLLPSKAAARLADKGFSIEQLLDFMVEHQEISSESQSSPQILACVQRPTNPYQELILFLHSKTSKLWMLWDFVQSDVSAGFPSRGRPWNAGWFATLPYPFCDGFDTVCNDPQHPVRLQGLAEGGRATSVHLLFFRQCDVLRWDFTPDKPLGVTSIAEEFPGLPEPFIYGVDAAVRQPTNGDRLIFFKEKSWVCYDTFHGRVVEGGAHFISDKWFVDLPEPFSKGISAVARRPTNETRELIFFSCGQYLFWDFVSECVSSGPLLLAEGSFARLEIIQKQSDACSAQLTNKQQRVAKHGTLTPWKKTEHVVRDIVIPESAVQRACYMDALSMHGGPQRAARLISHAWGSAFLDTFLNIILDATSWRADEVLEYTSAGCVDAESLHAAITRRAPSALHRTYWLCIFAVNEHRSICGDCWVCRSASSSPWGHVEFAADPCLCCGQPKHNPCACGLPKYQREDPCYELDKFDEVVSLMEGLVVSLDSELKTLGRIWVLAEIGQALAQKKHIQFRVVRGLAPEVLQRLQKGEALLQPVSQCHATSENDKQMILARIDETVGHDMFNAFLMCMVEICFGQFSRLQVIPANALAVLAEMPSLDVQIAWSREWLEDLAQLSMSHLAELRALAHLNINCAHCWRLRNVTVLSEALTGLISLNHLSVDLSHTAVSEIQELGAAVAMLPLLQHLDLAFSTCPLRSISAIMMAVSKLQQLMHFRLVIAGCMVQDIFEFGEAFTNSASSLKRLHVDFGGLTLESISALARALRMLPQLEELHLRVAYCRSLCDSSGLDGALSTRCSLRRLRLHFQCCSQLSAVPLTRMRPFFRQLEEVDVDFSGCSKLPLPLQRRFTDTAQLMHAFR